MKTVATEDHKNLDIDLLAHDAPLCVDLDGTLVRSNVFIESVLLLLKAKPLFFIFIPFILFVIFFSENLKSKFKSFTASVVIDDFHAENLPYEPAFVLWLREQKSNGRKLWLCSGSDQILAERVADHLGIFDGVLGSSPFNNFVAERKASGLVEKFGDRCFDYAGNSSQDIQVWLKSRKVIFVNVSRKLSKKWHELNDRSTPDMIFGAQNVSSKDFFRSMRPHQWVKNILIFVPLITAHRWADPSSIAMSVLAFFSFCLCASSVYLLNDLLDLNADRQHPQKCCRPLACGSMPLELGVALSFVLLVFSVAISFFVGFKFFICLAGYWALTLAYSIFIKRMMVLDVIVLAILYTARIVAGVMACAVALSFWLFLFSVFFFLSLALVKRYAELDHLQRTKSMDASGRGYRIEDLPLLQNIGTACGMMAVLVLGLYINAPEIKDSYHHPKAIWAFCVLLLYWIFRVWILTHRGQMKMDPVVFALEDKNSRVVALLGFIAFVVAL